MKEPKVGEWWLCQSVSNLKIRAMVRVEGGWSLVSDKHGNPDPSYIQQYPELKPLQKLIKVRRRRRKAKNE